MDESLQSLLTQAQDIWGTIVLQARLLLLPSRLIQIGLLVGAAVLAWGAARWTRARLRAWVRSTEGWAMWQVRLVLGLEKRLPMLFFAAFAWAETWAMRAVSDFPSRSFLLALVATIATALAVIALAVWLVRNPILRKLVRWGLWIFVTLYYLGLNDEAEALLDSAALSMGEFRLSLLTLLQAAVAVGVLVTLARLVVTASTARIRRNESISPSMQVLAVKLLQLALFGLAVVVGLRVVGVDLTGLAVLSGAIGVGLGFGLQKVVSNLVSGLILLLDRSIKPGDVISLGETFGWINQLGARYVSITTRDGKEYLIPNEDLITGQVVNWSHTNEFVRLDIHFGVSYADDPHEVRRIAIAAASTVPRVLSDTPPVCHITGFGESSVDYILRFWIRDPSGGLTNIRGNVFLALWDAFREHGISIPFPQREVRVLGGSLDVTRAEPDAGGPPAP